jgi:hypothetical protein
MKTLIEDITFIENKRVIDTWYNTTTEKSYLTFCFDNFEDPYTKSYFMSVRVNIPFKELKKWKMEKVRLLKVKEINGNYFSTQDSIQKMVIDDSEGIELFTNDNISFLEQLKKCFTHLVKNR